MQVTVTSASRRNSGGLSALVSRARDAAPGLAAWCAAVISSILLILSFPDFDLWPLAWVGLVPLFVTIGRNKHRPGPWRAFFLGWLTGSLFFYGSCYWLTFSMIHYGDLSDWFAYLLLIPATLAAGLFPGAFALVLAAAIRLSRTKALFLAPIFWVAFEGGRLAVTGQLWNAIGYSQAYEPLLIQPARWGGVYAVGFLIVTVNATVAFLILNRCKRAILISAAVIAALVIVIALSNASPSLAGEGAAEVHAVALQPNVPMDLVKSAEQMNELTSRHINLSEDALRQLPDDGIPRLLIWPESPMNFAYANDSQFRELIGRFARDHNTAVLFNSQEPAPNNGRYNSAVLINEQGSLVGQYDKIRLLPFGEYVPLPHWLPGSNLVTAIVGEFTPGTNYTLFPAGGAKVGVFICIESAYPSIARQFVNEGADVLINISNDGYLGRTAVMRQHLANAVFRAVENGRPVVRVTNTGITAYITPRGEIKEPTAGFEPAVRIWTLGRSAKDNTFYTRNGDVVAFSSAFLTVLAFAASLVARGFNRRFNIGQGSKQDLENA